MVLHVYVDLPISHEFIIFTTLLFDYFVVAGKKITIHVIRRIMHTLLE
jgi:hypothetical protein